MQSVAETLREEASHAANLALMLSVALEPPFLLPLPLLLLLLLPLQPLTLLLPLLLLVVLTVRPWLLQGEAMAAEAVAAQWACPVAVPGVVPLLPDATNLLALV